MQHSKSFSFSSCASPQGTALFRIQTVVLVHSIIKNIPPSLKIQEVLVCPKLTSINLTTFIEVKMHQHLQHQLSFIKSTMKYVLIMHLFGILDVNIFSMNLVKVREV